jgi:hypothetical protein
VDVVVDSGVDTQELWVYLRDCGLRGRAAAGWLKIDRDDIQG